MDEETTPEWIEILKELIKKSKTRSKNDCVFGHENFHKSKRDSSTETSELFHH